MSYEPQRFDFSIPVSVNLSSDTQTKPSRGMKEAMMEAEVGDEQMGPIPPSGRCAIAVLRCSERKPRCFCLLAPCATR